MARPEKFEDLTEWEQSPVDIAEVNVTEVIQHASPMFVGAAMNLIAIAEAEGYEVIRDGEWKVRRPKNEEERARILLSGQRTWDRGKERYDQAMSGEELDNFWARATVRFAEAEGLPIPPSLVEAEDNDA